MRSKHFKTKILKKIYRLLSEADEAKIVNSAIAKPDMQLRAYFKAPTINVFQNSTSVQNHSIMTTYNYYLSYY